MTRYMYGAPAGKMSLKAAMQRFSTELSGGAPESSSAPEPQGLESKNFSVNPGEMSGYGKPALSMFTTALTGPNCTVQAERGNLEIWRVRPTIHTRTSEVISVMNDLQHKPKSDYQPFTDEEVDKVNGQVYFPGIMKAFLNVYSTYGRGHKPTSLSAALGLMVNPNVELDPAFDDTLQEEMTRSMPFRSPAKLGLNDFFKPNLESGAGFPYHTKTKSDILHHWIPLVNQVFEEFSMDPVRNQPQWDACHISLKAELHDYDKLETKARAYYCYPAVTSLVLGNIMSHFSRKIPTIVDSPPGSNQYTNMVGLSFYHGGASRVLKWVENLEVSGAGYYGDDALLVLVCPSGRRFIFTPDIRKMDMNTPDVFIEPWLLHLYSFGAELDEKSHALFEQALDTYSQLLTDSLVHLPHKLVVKFTNYSKTGTVMNTYFQTFVNSLMFRAVLEPAIKDAMGELPVDATLEDELLAVKNLAVLLGNHMRRAGLAWKPFDDPYVYKGVIKSFLGHTLDKSNPFLFYLPRPRIFASLLNPRSRRKRALTNLCVAYARSLALLVSGGGCHPFLWSAARALAKRINSMSRGSESVPDYHKVLSSLHIVLDLPAHPASNLTIKPIDLRVENGKFKILLHPLPEKDKLLALIHDPKGPDLSLAYASLIEITAPSATPAPVLPAAPRSTRGRPSWRASARVKAKQKQKHKPPKRTRSARANKAKNIIVVTPQRRRKRDRSPVQSKPNTRSRSNSRSS